MQRVFVDDATAGRVEQVSSRLHAGKLRRTDEIARLIVQRAVDRNEVGVCHQFFERDQFHANCCCDGGIEKRIERNRLLHAEGGEELHERTSDSAQADDAERAVAEFAAHIRRAAIPFAGPHQAVFHAQMMREREHPTDGGFGHRAIDRAGRDEHEDIGRSAGGNIDGIVADAEPADGEEIAGTGDGCGRDARREHDCSIDAG